MSERIRAEDYVSDVDALVFLLEANGFKVAWGDFTHLDGRRSRVACQPVNPEKLAEAVIRACRWQAGKGYTNG